MSTVKDIARLGKLVASSHGWAAAKAFKSYHMTERDSAVLSQCAVDLLKVFPDSEGASPMLSAALAVRLEGQLEAPIHVVSGALAVEGGVVLGKQALCEEMEAPAGSEGGEDGHVWVMVGAYVVDISLFRIAYSRSGPAVLSRHVHQVFGPGKALYVDHWKRTPRMGLHYQPQRVLGVDEVTAYMGRAYHVIRQASSGQV